PACGAAVGAFVVAVAHAIARGEGPEAAYRAGLAWAQRGGEQVAVADVLARAATNPPVLDDDPIGSALKAVQNAFFELLHDRDVESGVDATVRRGGDTASNAAITGALLGAAQGGQDRKSTRLNSSHEW